MSEVTRGLLTFVRDRAHIRIEAHAKRNITRASDAERRDLLDPAKFATSHKRTLIERSSQSKIPNERTRTP